MIVFPAIDIKDGSCVRLFKGDFGTVEKVAEDPLQTARSFEAKGASWIHMVDLDGEGCRSDKYGDLSGCSPEHLFAGGGRRWNPVDEHGGSVFERRYPPGDLRIGGGERSGSCPGGSSGIR